MEPPLSPQLPKVYYVPYNEDLYALTVDPFGDMVYCEVSRGNRHSPYHEIHPDSVPAEVFNRLFHTICLKS